MVDVWIASIRKYKGVNLLCTHGWTEQTQHLFSWRLISQSEIRNSAAAKARAGREFLSPNPFPSRPARASGFVPAAPAARQSVNFVQNRFGFGCINAPISNFRLFGLPLRRRFAPPCTEKLARRARRGSLNRGSYSLRFLTICFAQLTINPIIL